MRTPVQSVDQGVLWLPLERLREMTGLEGEATLVTMAVGASPPGTALDAAGADGAEGWRWHGQDWLLADIHALIRAKMLGSMFVYALLLLLEPVLNSIWAWLAHAERPGPWSLAGCAIILVATLVRTLRGR